jgi:hypothetical protein
VKSDVTYASNRWTAARIGLTIAASGPAAAKIAAALAGSSLAMNETRTCGSRVSSA